jgi:hypothetical protein
MCFNVKEESMFVELRGQRARAHVFFAFWSLALYTNFKAERPVTYDVTTADNHAIRSCDPGPINKQLALLFIT